MDLGFNAKRSQGILYPFLQEFTGKSHAQGTQYPLMKGHFYGALVSCMLYALKPKPQTLNSLGISRPNFVQGVFLDLEVLGSPVVL